MRRAVLFLAVMMPLGGTAMAADNGWTAQMEEDEGGSVMVASVSAAPSGDVTPELRIMCAKTASLCPWNRCLRMNAESFIATFRFIPTLLPKVWESNPIVSSLSGINKKPKAQVMDLIS